MESDMAKFVKRQIGVPIVNILHELDRSVSTNLPLDPNKDNPYEAFRREHGLPDTPESLDEYCQAAYNWYFDNVPANSLAEALAGAEALRAQCRVDVLSLETAQRLQLQALLKVAFQ